jgi:hypothetical protein
MIGIVAVADITGIVADRIGPCFSQLHAVVVDMAEISRICLTIEGQGVEQEQQG